MTERATKIMRDIHRAELDGQEIRPHLTELLAHLGEGVEVRPPIRVDDGLNLSIGARTFVNFNLTALDMAPISIGADCQIGPNVQLLTPVHPLPQNLDVLKKRRQNPSPSMTTCGSAAE